MFCKTLMQVESFSNQPNMGVMPLFPFTPWKVEVPLRFTMTAVFRHVTKDRISKPQLMESEPQVMG
jgi:hypothetical protein